MYTRLSAIRLIFGFQLYVSHIYFMWRHSTKLSSYNMYVFLVHVLHTTFKISAQHGPISANYVIHHIYCLPFPYIYPKRLSAIYSITHLHATFAIYNAYLEHIGNL